MLAGSGRSSRWVAIGALLSLPGCSAAPPRIAKDTRLTTAGESPHACRRRGIDECRRACDARDAGACLEAAAAYNTGEGASKSARRMIELEHRACALGLAKGCTALANSHADERLGAYDPEYAEQLYDMACDAGDADACLAIASRMLLPAGPPRWTESAELARRVCEELGDARGCQKLGQHFRAGAGVPKDEARAQSLFQGACDQGDKDGCEALTGFHRGLAPLMPLAMPDPSFEALAEHVPALRDGREITIAICVGGTGKVVSASLEGHAASDEVDRLVHATIASWRFRPWDLPADLVVSCNRVTYHFVRTVQ